MKRFLSVCAGIAAAGVLTLAGAELALRAIGYDAPIWYQPDARLGWAMRPGARGWYTHEGRAFVEVNPLGWRDRVHTLAKPAGTYRIAVLGDSVAEALQLDLQKTFWWQLPGELAACPAFAGRKVEVLNFSASGYGSTQEALLLESTAIKYQPDLVLLAFAGNDVRDNSFKLTLETDRPFFVLDGKSVKLDTTFRGSASFRKYSSRPAVLYRASSDHLRLVQLVQKARQGFNLLRQAGSANAADADSPAVAGLEPGADLAVFAPPRDAKWQEAWDVTDRILARMNAFSKAHGARFATMVVTHSTQLYVDPAVRRNTEDALGVHDLFYIERHLGALGSREGFLVIPLAPEMQKRADAQKIWFHGYGNLHVGWGHWNEQGHRAAAELVGKALCQNP